MGVAVDILYSCPLAKFRIRPVVNLTSKFPGTYGKNPLAKSLQGW
jgi:hypothetical protein